MITEQRLTFEAKHKVPDDVIWNEPYGEYTNKYTSIEWYNENAMVQNALWQGYQSALEDRQGEAVAWAAPAAIEHLKTHDNTACTLTPFECTANTVPLFTSPQPAQPGQWNAAIEAAAEAARKVRYRAPSTTPLGDAIDAILALRKGA